MFLQNGLSDYSMSLTLIGIFTGRDTLNEWESLNDPIKMNMDVQVKMMHRVLLALFFMHCVSRSSRLAKEQYTCQFVQ